MWNQTATLYHKTIDGDYTNWTRHVLYGVHISYADGQTINAHGITQQGGSKLMVRKKADMLLPSSGDYIISGECDVESFTGSASKVLSDYAPMKISGRKYYPYRSSLAHASFTLEGKAWT